MSDSVVGGEDSSLPGLLPDAGQPIKKGEPINKEMKSEKKKWASGI